MNIRESANNSLEHISATQWKLLSQDEREALVRLIRDRERQNGSSRRRAVEVSRNFLRRVEGLKVSRPSYSKRELALRYSPQDVADALVPNRRKLWRLVHRRKPHTTVFAREFSFIDNPAGTVKTLREIINAESSAYRFDIDFEDHDVLDASPFLLMTACIPVLRRFWQSGYMNPQTQSVLRAMHLDQHLGLKLPHARQTKTIYPFPLRTLPPGSLSSRDTAAQISRREKVQADLIECINGWLNELTPPFELTEKAEVALGDSIGETLCNAQRHSDAEQTGGWWIGGFMKKHQGENGAVRQVCHLAIFNVGESIAHTLMRSPQKNERFWPLFNGYKQLHPHVPDELCATICAIQDGVSRNGYDHIGEGCGLGLQALITNIGALASTKAPTAPGITIWSGKSCLLFRDNYLLSQIAGVDVPRQQWFNAAQSPNMPPDERHAFVLDCELPGTLIAIRFEIDVKDLEELDDETGEQDGPSKID